MRYLLVSLFIACSSLGFSQYKVSMSKDRSMEYFKLRFDYSKQGSLEIYQNDKVIKVQYFEGSKTFKFEKYVGYGVGFCNVEGGIQLIFFEEIKSGLPCDVIDIPLI